MCCLMHIQLKPFNSRPHKEVDKSAASQAWQNILSIHDLTRRSTSNFMLFLLHVDQLSIHDLTRRSTVYILFLSMITLSFNSRPHKEVDTIEPPSFPGTASFNSRPHKEVDQLCIATSGRQEPFNSRPHKEVDLNRSCHTMSMELSIHDLTRRSTFLLPFSFSL